MAHQLNYGHTPDDFSMEDILDVGISDDESYDATDEQSNLMVDTESPLGYPSAHTVYNVREGYDQPRGPDLGPALQVVMHQGESRQQDWLQYGGPHDRQHLVQNGSVWPQHGYSSSTLPALIRAPQYVADGSVPPMVEPYIYDIGRQFEPFAGSSGEAYYPQLSDSPHHSLRNGHGAEEDFGLLCDVSAPGWPGSGPDYGSSAVNPDQCGILGTVIGRSPGRYSHLAQTLEPVQPGQSYRSTEGNAAPALLDGAALDVSYMTAAASPMLGNFRSLTPSNAGYGDAIALGAPPNIVVSNVESSQIRSELMLNEQSESGFQTSLQSPGRGTLSTASVTGNNVLCCQYCSTEFTGEWRKANCGRHVRNKHRDGVKAYDCEVPDCYSTFKRTDARLKHYRKVHPGLVSTSPSTTNRGTD